MKIYILVSYFILCVIGVSTAQTGSVTNILVNQRIDVSGLVDIYFTLSGNANAYNIALEASLDAGNTYTAIPVINLSGDIASISPGSNKHIIWDALSSVPNTYSTQSKLKIIASESGFTVTDIDGNIYPTVVIGTQEWMAENLKVTHYRNGEPIPNVTDDTQWYDLITGAYCWYNNDESTYGDTYGALYKWITVVNSRNLCPVGWHIPTDAEWTTLTSYLGGTYVAGGKMKEMGTTHWQSPNTGATNESGFTGLPGGDRSGNGTFGSLGSNGYWWSSTQLGGNTAWTRNLIYNNYYVYRYQSSQDYGFSVRCVRD